MKLPGTSWFWITVAMIAVVAVCLAPGPVEAGWYDYQDSFKNNFADTLPPPPFWQRPFLHATHLPHGSQRIVPFPNNRIWQATKQVSRTTARSIGFGASPRPLSRSFISTKLAHARCSNALSVMSLQAT